MRAPYFLGALAFAALSAACEIQECDNEDTGADGVCLKSLKRFEGETVRQRADYTSDLDVVIDSPNGDVRVIEGDYGDELSVRFEPFVMRAFDTPRDVAQEDLDEIQTSIAQSNRGYVISVDPPNGVSGADITVSLPRGFAATLDIDQNNGSTDVRYVGDAPAVIVDSENGSCNVNAGWAERISVYCDNGDLTASIDASVPQTGSGFATGNGSVELWLPPDGVFSVQAQALAGGVVTVADAPSSCVLATASEGSKTLSCNGATELDPVYVVVADGTSLADVVLRF
jgi:hypothetical protein